MVRSEAAIVEARMKPVTPVEFLAAGADSSIVGRGLSGRAKQFAAALVTCDGKLKEACSMVHLSEPEGRKLLALDGFEAYMSALAAEMSVKAGLSVAQVVSRVNRIALSAEQGGKLSVALEANRMLGSHLGMFPKSGSGVVVNAGNGAVVQLVAGEAPRADGAGPEVIDAEYVEDPEMAEILALNGRS